MKAHQASLYNAILLIALSIWGYFSSETPSFTAFIPTVIGAALLFLNPGVKKENKVIAHVAVILTFLILIGLVKPYLGALGRDNMGAVIRLSIMFLSTLFALALFIKSFIDNRKRRTSGE